MIIMEYIKEKDIINLLLIGLLIILIFRFSGDIVTSVFNIGAELGQSIGDAI
ncbi:MAG: hypothetical protein U9N10_07230 [Bacillota bacterium]|nr:hypothetical protein [Bacillota bacterium]